MLFGRSNAQPWCWNANVGSFCCCLCRGWRSHVSFLPSLLGWSLLAPPSSFAAILSVGEVSPAFASPPFCCASLGSKREMRVKNAAKREKKYFFVCSWKTFWCFPKKTNNNINKKTWTISISSDVKVSQIYNQYPK